MTVTRPALRYHGGKWRLATTVIDRFPAHRIYVEPFGGAASVLLRKRPSYAEVYNDLDGEIVNVFKQLRDNGPALKRLLQLTPFSRTEYFGAYDPADSDLEQARRTIIKSYMGFGSDAIWRASGFRANSNRSGTTPAHDWKNYADAADPLIERLRNVVIEERDAVKVIEAHDTAETFFYVDPPYVHSTRTSAKRYGREMIDEQHTQLAAALHSVKGKVLISGYASELYDGLYEGWNRFEFDSMADGARKRREVLWANFDQNTLFNMESSK